MMSVEDEINREIYSMFLKSSGKVGETFADVLSNTYKSIYEKGIESGEIKPNQLKKITDNFESIEFSALKQDLKEFDEVCKHYKVRYSIKKDLTDPNKVVLFYEAKNVEQLNKCLEKYIEVHEKIKQFEKEGKTVAVKDLLTGKSKTPFRDAIKRAEIKASEQLIKKPEKVKVAGREDR